MNDTCEDCGGSFTRNSCICALAEEIRSKLAIICLACAGKNVEHNHWIKNIDYDSNPNIEVTQLPTVSYENLFI